MRPKYASKTEEGEIPITYGVWTGQEDRPSRRRICLSRNSSSCAVEQFHSEVCLEAVDRRASNSSKTWHWTTEGGVTARRSTPSPHDGEWPHSFLQAVRITLFYCYRCTKPASSIRRRLRNVLCGQDCLYTGFPSRQTIDGCICNGLVSSEPGNLIGTMLSFLMNHAASICITMMAAFMLDAMLSTLTKINLDFL